MEMLKDNLSSRILVSCLILWILNFNHGNSQNSWVELNINQNIFSGIPVSCADINGDALDDLLVLDQTKHLWMGTNTGLAHFIWTPLDYHQIYPGWSINVGDIDRNGKNDIIISGENTQVTILYQQDQGFTKELVDESIFLSQAAALFDLNQDGWLDFVLCDDNEASRVYINSAGKLIRDSIILDLSLPDRSKTGGNYGCIVTDFDWDGDPDLYISKCRPGVDDPTDLRRVNLFYINEGTGWKERGKDVGLNIGDQSWISIFEDFDKDGLFDVFVINHYSPCKLLRQKADHSFEDVTIQSGIDYNALGLQAIPVDFDNDGDIDILLSGTAAQLWLNDGAMHFVKSSILIGNKTFSSCASGDFNNDGWMDLYISYANLLNRPNNQKDKIWLNPGGTNHYLKLSFNGDLSNKNGIGTKIKLYTNGELQVRELHGGESYGIQNSLNLHFGLGSNKTVDSLIVYWPSGQVRSYYQIGADKQYVIDESGCMVDFSATPSAALIPYCNRVDTFLQVAKGLKNILWNEGTTDSILHVVKDGIYFYKAVNTNNNCLIISNPISFAFNPKQNPKLTSAYSKILCRGEQIELTTSAGGNILWSTGDRSPKITVDKAGIYYATQQGYCELENTDTLEVLVYNPPTLPVIKPDTLYQKGPAKLLGDRNQINWFDRFNDIIPLFSGKNYLTDSIFNSRSYWAESYENHQYPYARGGLKEPSFVSSPYHASFINNKMQFNVYTPIELDSVTVFTDDPGERIIELLDQRGVLLAQKIVNLTSGKSQIYLGFHIEPNDGLFALTTNGDKNMQVFGQLSPKLYRSDKDFYYPFFIEDKLRIVTSDKGDSYFYYFYDWVIRKSDQLCYSDRIEVPIVFIPDGTKEVSNQGQIMINHNGSSFTILSDKPDRYAVKLINLGGGLIKDYSTVSDHVSIELPHLASAVYILSVQSKSSFKKSIFKLVVIK